MEKNGWKKSGNSKNTICNLDLIKELYNLTQEESIKYIHVRSHQKEPKDKESEKWFLWNGNDMADKLACKAMNKIRNI